MLFKYWTGRHQGKQYGFMANQEFAVAIEESVGSPLLT
jgi:hypothetical protein